MEFGQRIKNLRLQSSMTQKDLAGKVGVSVMAVRNWESGAKKPNMDALLSMAKVFCISLDTLLGVSSVENPYKISVLSADERHLLNRYRKLDKYGKRAVSTVCAMELERVEDAEKEKASVKTIIELKNSAKSERFIPRYSTPAAAGTSVPLDGDDFEMMLVDDSVPLRADYAVNIQGDSMYPYIKDGDMVYVQKDAELSIGDVGIWCVDGAMYCKQYYLDEERNLLLVSANPKLKNTNVFVPADGNNTVKFCGKVLLGRKINLPDYLFDN